MSDASRTPLLDTIETPEDLRRLPEADLQQVVDELRQETIAAVSVTGGTPSAGTSNGFGVASTSSAIPADTTAAGRFPVR